MTFTDTKTQDPKTLKATADRMEKQYGREEAVRLAEKFAGFHAAKSQSRRFWLSVAGDLLTR